MLIAQRALTPEIMDGSDFTPAELSKNLADIRLYHRLTGGLAALLRAIGALTRGIPEGGRLSALDVGAGSADIASLVASWMAHRGFRPSVVASDLNLRMLRVAAQGNGAGRRAGRVVRCAADGRALPHRDAAFDVAYSCLMLHHLDDEAIGGVLAEMKRVTRLGFVVLDLRRSVLALASVWALTRLTSRNRLTLNDGPLSVRRSLTLEETLSCARRGGLGESSPPRSNGGGLAVRRDGLARLILTFRHAEPRGAS